MEPIHDSSTCRQKATNDVNASSRWKKRAQVVWSQRGDRGVSGLRLKKMGNFLETTGILGGGGQIQWVYINTDIDDDLL